MIHQNKTKNNKTDHEPVLLAHVLHYLDPLPGNSYLDVTAGYGGHAQAVGLQIGPKADRVLVDRDSNAITFLRARYGIGTDIRHQDFVQASRELIAENVRFDLILADLGVSSPHLNDEQRGFAFSLDAPLDMRMDQRQVLTAAHIVNNYSEEQLTEILVRYGEEPKARSIARLIVEHRPIHTTTELAAIAARAWPGHSRTHPATRTFQAIRIAVNDELGQLAEALSLWLALLAPGGRMAVISFHSLEDRIVKQMFNDVSGDRYDAMYRLLTKRPAVASPNEIASNPRARSAKLRAVVKIKTKERN